MNTEPVIKKIIIINVIMFVMSLFTDNFMYRTFSLFSFESDLFHPYQLITHMFMHADFFHIFFNMYTLWMFGNVLERVWGGKKFFLFYMVTGLGAAILHNLVIELQLASLHGAAEAGNVLAMQRINIMNMTPTVGASGAIYGVLLGYGMLFPNNTIQLFFPPVALKAKWFVIIFGAIELILGLSGSGGNIAHFAHLGGMIFGYLLIRYWKKNNTMYY